MPEEDLVVSSEDVRCFFHIFRIPRSWYKYIWLSTARYPLLFVVPNVVDGFLVVLFCPWASKTVSPWHNTSTGAW